MKPAEILTTEHLRKSEPIDHPDHEHAFRVEAHVGRQAGYTVYGFRCPKCGVGVAVNDCPSDFQHTCGAFVKLVLPPQATGTV